MYDLYARLLDIADRACRAGIAYSPFVSMEHLAEGYAIAKNKGIKIADFGGYDDAERKLICFYTDDEIPEFPIDCVFISSREELKHSQILGAVLGLGLERDTLGDIVLQDGGAYIFCLKHIANFIVDNLLTVGREHVKTKKLSSLPKLERAPGIQKRVTISSLRLDALISTALNLSRTKAVTLVSQSRVYLNHSLETKGDRRIDVGDIISIRGAGRIELLSVGELTKKGKIPLQIETFLNDRRRI